MIKVAVCVMSRANYGRLKSVIDNIIDSPSLELQLILGASFYNADIPYTVDARIQCLINSDDHEAMAITTGVLLPQIAHTLQRLQPDVVLVHGDRYEVLACAIASSYLNIPLAHTEGGEDTGCIDDKVRNAITALADIHFVVNREALKRIPTNKDNVYVVGSPALDLLEQYNLTSSRKKPYVLVLHHPNTTKNESINALIDALKNVPYDIVWVNPNIDAGNKAILKQIHSLDVEFVKDLSPVEYYRLLKNCKCAIGNSSSFIKEGAYFGTPVVMIGDRQQNRDCASNIHNVSCEDSTSILNAIIKQSESIYPRSYKFGQADSGKQIADILRKKVTYEYTWDNSCKRRIKRNST